MRICCFNRAIPLILCVTLFQCTLSQDLEAQLGNGSQYDFNSDGIVDVDDLNKMLSVEDYTAGVVVNASTRKYDLNKNGELEQGDITLMLGHVRQGPTSTDILLGLDYGFVQHGGWLEGIYYGNFVPPYSGSPSGEGGDLCPDEEIELSDGPPRDLEVMGDYLFGRLAFDPNRPWSCGDVNGDGVVNGADYFIVRPFINMDDGS